MARPPGTTFLGVKNTLVRANLMDHFGIEKDVIMDTGSDITLISEEAFKEIPEKPNVGFFRYWHTS
jgi:hypothetical protein